MLHVSCCTFVLPLHMSVWTGRGLLVLWGGGVRSLTGLTAPVTALDVAASIRPSATPCMKFQGSSNK